MAKTNTIEIIPNFAIKRREYNPNVIHNHGMCDVIVYDDSIEQYTEPSITDKESYRITLASMRSAIKNASGSGSTGSYSLKDGKYNPQLDFSYLNRKDLTIVDITNYINRLKSNLENYDAELRVRIQQELDKASALKEVKEKETVSKSSTSES